MDSDLRLPTLVCRRPPRWSQQVCFQKRFPTNLLFHHRVFLFDLSSKKEQPSNDFVCRQIAVERDPWDINDYWRSPDRRTRVFQFSVCVVAGTRSQSIPRSCGAAGIVRLNVGRPSTAVPNKVLFTPHRLQLSNSAKS